MELRGSFELKRELGLFEATVCGIGIILGAGIYALIGKAAGLAGYGVWISFLIAALAAALTALSYAELASIFPRAGAEYVYVKEAFGEQLGFLVGWLLIVTGLVGASTVALGFAGYAHALFGSHLTLTALLTIFLLSLLIFCGIKQSAWVAIAFTLVEAAGLFFVIGVGLPNFGRVDYFQLPDLSGLLAGAVLIFFAYLGFEEISRLAEETKNPTKNIPRALLLSVTITALIYVLVAFASISIVTPAELAVSTAPLAIVVEHAMGAKAFVLFSVVALFATANTVLLILLATSRILYGMACAGSLPPLLASVHPLTRTPWAAIACLAACCIPFVLLGRIEVVANLTNFAVLLTFLLVNLSLVWLRYSKPNLHRPFMLPLNLGKLPVLALFSTLSCVLLILHVQAEIWLGGGLMLLAGLLFQKFCRKHT